MIEKILHNNRLLALIIRAEEQFKPGVEFFSPDDSAQQVGAMSWPAGHKVLPHTHRPVERNITSTQEVLVIRKGKLRADFYGDDNIYIESRILVDGDIIFLSSGGHGFTMLEDTVMIEIKQGPYAGVMDKVRFEPVNDSELNLIS